MSMDYWMCEGIGIRTNDLYNHLNKVKCIAVLEKQLGDDFELDSDGGFDIDDYFYGEPFDSLADLLCHCDDTNTLTFGDNGNGEYYFYYTPSYPWDRAINEPFDIADVHRRIVDAVKRLCDLSTEQIEAMIDDDIYDYGCG